MPAHLVIHEDDSARDEVVNALKRAFGDPEAVIINVGNFKDALNQARYNPEWATITVSTTAPLSATSGNSPNNSDAACAFIDAMREKQKDRPFLAVGPCDDDPAVRRVLAGWTAAAQFKLDFLKLEEYARALRQQIHVESSIELEIALKDRDSGYWWIRRRGLKGFPDEGALRIDGEVLKDIVAYSNMASRCDETDFWTTFADISSKLRRLLFECNPDLTTSFYQNVGCIGGIDKSEILFTMTPQGQRAMVEALREGRSDNGNCVARKDFWMLKLPIVRQYEISGGQPPLFVNRDSDDLPVNCLIINADPAAGTLKTAPWAGRCEALEQVEAEAGDIYRRLKQAPPEHVGVVEVLDLSIDPPSAKSRVTAKLAERPWHLIHFAGHGVLGKDEKRTPGLVLSAASDVVLPFSVLAAARTRFLFMSACRSASSDFITKAIEFSVPMVVGFQWTVDDVEAAEFAKKFYECLFDASQPTFKSIYRTLVATRLAAFNREPEGRTWASPVLLTQARQRHAS